MLSPTRERRVVISESSFASSRPYLFVTTSIK
nr:MAG TPA: hypothetical protein [Caudoviricetes sp.]